MPMTEPPKRTVEELQLKVEVDRSQLDPLMSDIEKAAKLRRELEMPYKPFDFKELMKSPVGTGDDFVQQLGARFATLEMRLAVALEQLDSTEKAYDKALQENIALQDETKRVRLGKMYGMSGERAAEMAQEMREFPNFGEENDFGVEDPEPLGLTDEAAQRLVQGMNAEDPAKIEVSGEVKMTAATDAAAGEPVHVHLSGNEEVVSHSVGSLSRTTIKPRPEMSGENALGTWPKLGPTAQEFSGGVGKAFGGYGPDMIIIDDPLGPNSDQKDVRDWYAKQGLEVIEERPPAAVPAYGEKQLPQVVDGLWHSNYRLRSAVKREQGARAKMKDSLTQSQNANRRYKKRIAKMKEQIQALSALSDAAFPVYLMLSDAIAGEVMEGATAEFMVVKRPKLVQEKCVEFHNKFNEAAEVFRNE